jgi:hypothetical protein
MFFYTSAAKPLPLYLISFSQYLSEFYKVKMLRVRGQALEFSVK